jgi:hypothetical protein
VRASTHHTPIHQDAFRVVNNGNQGANSGELKFDGKEYTINLQGDIAGDTSLDNNQKLAHEFEHGRQVLDHELGFKQNDAGEWKPFAHDLFDEVKGFMAGFDAQPATPGSGDRMNGLQDALNRGGLKRGAEYLQQRFNYHSPAVILNVVPGN